MTMSYPKGLAHSLTCKVLCRSNFQRIFEA